MSCFRSPFHDSHILSLRNLSPHFQTDHPCDFCRGCIRGSTSVYCCEKCGFYIHASCTTLPSQIQHPDHPHPLDLHISGERFKYFHYRCVDFNRRCNFELSAGTAMEDSWVLEYYCQMPPEARVGHSRLQFFHEHPLTSFPVRTGILCGGCRRQISSEDEAYGCRVCRFFLHEACAEARAKAPLEIQSHPFHPKHPLHLFSDSSFKGSCHACGDSCAEGWKYRCEECKLKFHLSCVISTMPCEDDDEEEEIRRRPSVMDHSLHPHQLSSHHSKTQTRINCRICGMYIPSGDFLGCSDCGFFLHGSCAQPPPADAIQRYLHPEHTLTLAHLPGEKQHGCASCEYLVRRSDSYWYTCQVCDFCIHRICASAILLDLEKGAGMTVQCSFHEHELKLYYDDRFQYCTVCDDCIWADPGYKCISRECFFKLHISCAQLPSNLVHPSHSLHPLTLCHNPPHKYIECRARSGSRSKHIDIKYLAIKERVKENKVVIEHVRTELMIADPLTKGMPPMKYKDHVTSMGIVPMM